MSYEEDLNTAADNYATGRTRKDGHGFSSYPDTHELLAFIAGAKWERARSETL